MVALSSLVQPESAAVAGGAWQALVGEPLPSRRQEDWRFNDLGLIAGLEPRLWTAADPFGKLELPAGISRIPLGEAAAELQAVLQQSGCDHHWPVRLNGAAQPAWLALRVNAEACEPLTLELDAGAAGELLAVRVLLVLEPGASLVCALHCTAAAAGLTSVVVASVLAVEASLELATVAEGHAEAALLGHLPVLQAPGSALTLTTVTAGWGFSRLEPRVLQQAGAARSRLRGLQWVGGTEMADTHALVRFEGPEGELDQVHKTVADDAGRSIFNGAVQVPRAAQRTDAAQLSRSLLLSDRARIDTKPELEIVADDVKCAHGATISQLQSEELFYLQSRGLSRDQAARLLLQGYCNEVLRELPAAAQAWQPLAAQLGRPA